MIHRQSTDRLLELSKSFKAVAVTGPRQSGKTTLIRSLFPDKTYINLENPDTRSFAIEDPRGFLEPLKKRGAILDEIQRVPLLFSYLQQILDETSQKGLFILSGSNNFLLFENINQTLAGRIAYFELLPFTISEIQVDTYTDDELMLKGFYPPIHDQSLNASEWIKHYVKTYVERDVRQIKNILDLNPFENFMKLLAARTANELNQSEIAIQVGVDSKTVQSWIGILAASYIIYLQKPYYKNFNKTIVKRPKVYFYDTAVVCHLLGITNTDLLSLHPFRGAIFENMVVNEFHKVKIHLSTSESFYFWRDKAGHEIDLIAENALQTNAYEIKSGSTIHSKYFKNLLYWKKLNQKGRTKLLYAHKESQKRSNGIEIYNWREEILHYSKTLPSPN